MNGSGIEDVLKGLRDSINGIALKEKDKGTLTSSFPVRRMIAAFSIIIVLIGSLILGFLFLSPYGEPPCLDADSLEAISSVMDGQVWRVIDSDRDEISRMLSSPSFTIRTERGKGAELLFSMGEVVLSFIPSDGAMECLHGKKRLRLYPYPDDRGGVASFYLTDGELSAAFVPLE